MIVRAELAGIAGAIAAAGAGTSEKTLRPVLATANLPGRLNTT
jgi:hypothetical protein